MDAIIISELEPGVWGFDEETVEKNHIIQRFISEHSELFTSSNDSPRVVLRNDKKAKHLGKIAEYARRYGASGSKIGEILAHAAKRYKPGDFSGIEARALANMAYPLMATPSLPATVGPHGGTRGNCSCSTCGHSPCGWCEHHSCDCGVYGAVHDRRDCEDEKLAMGEGYVNEHGFVVDKPSTLKTWDYGTLNDRCRAAAAHAAEIAKQADPYPGKDTWRGWNRAFREALQDIGFDIHAIPSTDSITIGEHDQPVLAPNPVPRGTMYAWPSVVAPKEWKLP